MKKLIVTTAIAGALIGGIGTSASAANNKSSDDLIIINKAVNEEVFIQDGKLKYQFSVATGKTKDLTPEGNFKIAQKIVNRPYYTGKIPGGDPRNPLGNRWLGIAIPNKGSAASWGGVYGIHGNNNPASIGTYASGGCIRMLDEEIENKLYPDVLLNTPVYITSSYKSFADIAKEKGYTIFSNPADQIKRTLKYGSRGNDVIVLQNRLNELEFSVGKVDGIFGTGTKTAVIKFQKEKKLVADGIVGTATKNALFSLFR
ncbi:L,D-transpeptidase family protein [Fictibacillus sp. NRS-1165]|uniref:L,D-transpeptidase family protein n=1 Tax=Fictibacillus sp. NRS-1165 TaxID=3144463 RepID=UPI003D19DC5E